MTENQPSSSLSKADLDLSLKRMSVQLWILEGCDNNKPLLLKQDGCLGCFYLEFDRVIGDLPFTDNELAHVYMAGLKDEIAASLHPFMPTSLLEAIYLSQEATKVVAERQQVDGSSLSTQEVQEKSLEDQEACGSFQEDSVGKQGDRRATRIRGGCDCKEPLVLKQHGSIAEFNLDFDLVTSHLTLTEEELVCVYIDGLDHEIAALGRLSWPRTLREAKHQARCHEFLIEIKDSRAYNDDEDVLGVFMRVVDRSLNKVQQKKNLMNIKLSYSNEAIKQRLEELQNIKDNLIRENSARKKNLCEDCMKLLHSNDLNEPMLPGMMKKKIDEIGGYDIIKIIEKKVYESDLRKNNDRLSIPEKKILLKAKKFLKPEELDLLMGKDAKTNKLKGIPVLVLDPNLKAFNLVLKRWEMTNSITYNLTHQWNEIVKCNNFQVGDVLQLWSFRRLDHQLGFALVKV